MRHALGMIVGYKCQELMLSISLSIVTLFCIVALELPPPLWIIVLLLCIYHPLHSFISTKTKTQMLE